MWFVGGRSIIKELKRNGCEQNAFHKHTQTHISMYLCVCVCIYICMVVICGKFVSIVDSRWALVLDFDSEGGIHF